MRLKDKEKIIKEHFRVAIFGSARIKRGDSRYKFIKRLATKIGDEGVDLVTGGGPGLMNAASTGHYLSKNRKKVDSIGLLIRLPKEQTTARHLDLINDFNKFSGRLDKFMELSNVVIVAPGGIGTLLEFVYTWQLVQVRKKKEIPIILIGKLWEKLIRWIIKYPLQRKFLDKEDIDPIFIVHNMEDAIKIIRESHIQYHKGKRLSCSDLRKRLKI